MKPIEVKPVMKLEQGAYKGVITKMEQRTTPEKYEYLNIHIEVDKDRWINASYPANISEKSNLGLLLLRFGIDLVVGEELDIEKLLIGKKVSFLVKEDGEFSKVVHDTLKPV